MKKYNKLVRDRIPEIIKADNEVPITHIADEQEYKEQLEKKVQEEFAEFLAEPCTEEAADMLEVLRALCVLHNISFADVETARKDKAEKRGGFGERIILDQVK